MISFINHLANVHVETVDSNGSVNFGSAIHKALTADEQTVGGQSVVGDFSPLKNSAINVASDPDLIDQSQLQF